MIIGKRLKPGKIIMTLVLFIFGFLVLYPLLFMVVTSLKRNIDILTNPFGITSVHFKNYIVAWETGRIATYLWNSVKVTSITLGCQLVVISLAAYAIGKLKPWGYQIIFSLILMMMFVTTEMVTVPNYTTMRDLGMIGNHSSLIVWYTAAGLVMGTYVLTNFVRGLPKELDEAALIDGAGMFQILLKIDLPLVVPAMATIVIFNFNGIWSEFYWALITVNRFEHLKTLPLGLINFSSQFSSNYGVLTAGLCILTAPVVVVFLFFSKYFIANIAAGAVKG